MSRHLIEFLPDDLAIVGTPSHAIIIKLRDAPLCSVLPNIIHGCVWRMVAVPGVVTDFTDPSQWHGAPSTPSLVDLNLRLLDAITGGFEEVHKPNATT